MFEQQQKFEMNYCTFYTFMPCKHPELIHYQLKWRPHNHARSETKTVETVACHDDWETFFIEITIYCINHKKCNKLRTSFLVMWKIITWILASVNPILSASSSLQIERKNFSLKKMFKMLSRKYEKMCEILCVLGSFVCCVTLGVLMTSKPIFIELNLDEISEVIKMIRNHDTTYECSPLHINVSHLAH